MNNYRNDYACMTKTTNNLGKNKYFLYRNLSTRISEYKETPQSTMIMR